MKVGEIKLTRRRIRLNAALAFVPSMVIPVGLIALHMRLSGDYNLQIDAVMVLIGVLVSLPVLGLVHEVLHLVAAWTVGVPRDNAQLSMKDRIPHVTITKALSVRQLRIITMCPFMVLGAGTCAWTLLSGSPLAAMICALALATASTDVDQWRRLRAFRPDDKMGESEDRWTMVIERSS